MRDIKPIKKSRGHTDFLPPDDLPPDVKELYRKRSPSRKKPKLAGSTVPVASIQVPHDDTSKKAGLFVVKKMSKKIKTDIAQTKVKNTDVKKGKESPRIKTRNAVMKLGQKERATIFILSMFAILLIGIALFVFLPKADIEMVLQTAPLLVDQDITLSASSATSDDMVPGKSFEQDVEVEGASPVVSTEIIGTKAHGTVSIVNKTIEQQKIKEQSRLVTKDGVLFFMQSHAILPAASTGNPSRVAVEVEASEPGDKGNIEPQRLDFAALNEESQTVLYAEATQPLSGGSGEEIKVVKEEDLAQAQAAAGQAAKQQVEQSIRSELPEGWTILEESWDYESVSFKPGASVEDKKDAVSFTARMNVRVMAYEEPKLEERIKKALDERLEEDYMLFPGPVSYTKSVKSIDWEKGEAVVTARVTHTTVPTFSLETLREKLARRTQSEAQEYLEGLRGVESVSMDVWPFWARRIPAIDKRISIDFISNRQP